MVFPILGGNSAVAGYSIDNSLRFNRADNCYLNRTVGSTTNRQTFTFSFWLKRARIASTQLLLDCGTASTDSGRFKIVLTSAYQLAVEGGATSYRKSSMLLRDVSAWYHIVVAVDSTQSTADDRVKIYVNGTQLSDFDTNNTMALNQNTPISESGKGHRIGFSNDNDACLGGYLTEWHFIDGQQLSPTDFGEFDENSGIWKPIEYTGSYGTNGFYLDFENSGSLGTDQSGNGNNFTPTNLSATDQVLDSPTNNFATLNELTTGTYPELREGNLQQYNHDTADSSGVASTFMPKTGKWYCEMYLESPSAGDYPFFGVIDQSQIGEKGTHGSRLTAQFEIDGVTNSRTPNNMGTITFDNTNWQTFADNDIVMFCLDCDNKKWWIGRNGTWTNSGNPASGTNQQLSWTNATEVCSGMLGYSGGGGGGDQSVWNFGQDGSFAGKTTAQGNADENGYGDFYYTPPSGYLALCTQNLATALSPTIDDGSAYFQTALYTGNGTAIGSGGLTITNDGNSDLQPDFIWFKKRSTAESHAVGDSNRGTHKGLFPNETSAESSGGNQFIDSFNTDGFTVGNVGWVNDSGYTYVAWQWKCNAGTNVSNTDGSITSTVQANTTAGFSIVTYTGTGSNATVGHGLGVAPKMVIVKDRSVTKNWGVWHEGLGGGDKYIKLNTTDATTTATDIWNNTVPTSSVFSIGGASTTNSSGDNYVAYCFAEIEGYSKFGSYTGNGSTDSPFIYLGFRPAWILFKSSSYSGQDWVIMDAKRTAEYNPTDGTLYPNNNFAEVTSIDRGDILSNGYKLRNTSPAVNQSGQTYIYMAFAENPFVTLSGVPVVAR